MPAITKTKAFAVYGTKCRNVRWSWSAVSDDGKTVVLVFWKDRAPGGLDSYSDWGWAGTRVVEAVGNRYRKEHIQHAINKLGGIVRVVWAEAVDPNANPRRVKRWRALPDVTMKITDFDPDTGQWKAERVHEQND